MTVYKVVAAPNAEEETTRPDKKYFTRIRIKNVEYN